ncbi:hypothetical protein ACJX0J_016247, partial [Zea mays]
MLHPLSHAYPRQEFLYVFNIHVEAFAKTKDKGRNCYNNYYKSLAKITRQIWDFLSDSESICHKIITSNCLLDKVIAGKYQVFSMPTFVKRIKGYKEDAIMNISALFDRNHLTVMLASGTAIGY